MIWEIRVTTGGLVKKTQAWKIDASLLGLLVSLRPGLEPVDLWNVAEAQEPRESGDLEKVIWKSSILGEGPAAMFGLLKSVYWGNSQFDFRPCYYSFRCFRPGAFLFRAPPRRLRRRIPFSDSRFSVAMAKRACTWHRAAME